MSHILTQQQIQSFITDGFIRIDNAFPEALATEARAVLWNDIPAAPDDPATWTQPVVRLGMYSHEPFIKAANTPVLHQAFDQLAGPGRWMPCMSMGTFPVRFPSANDPGDTGWHVDAGFPGTDPSDYFGWRINIRSKGRALLMLFLFSDVTEADAPTKLLKGSHRDIARKLASQDENGLSFMELATQLPSLSHCQEIVATGKAGTVYLCHPFMVHGAQAHHGSEPRFLAQPPLLLRHELNIEGSGPFTPVEESIRAALLS
jgi:hypothetical protein